jgi:hypothetical protein
MKHKTKKNKKYYLDHDDERIGVDKESLRRRQRREFNPQKMKQMYSAYAASQAVLLEHEEEEDESDAEKTTETVAIKNGSH